MYVNPTDINNPYLRSLLIFDGLTHLFGSIIFGLTSFIFHYCEIYGRVYRTIKYNSFNSDYSGYTGLTVFIVWSITALHHQNWVIGTMAILMLFLNCFLFGPINYSIDKVTYRPGCIHHQSLDRCFWLSVILHIPSSVNTTSLDVFQFGICFCAMIIGCTSQLILSSYFYNTWVIDWNPKSYFTNQVMMSGRCLALMYVHPEFPCVSLYHKIGGTFFVLWLLNLQRGIFGIMNASSLTVASGLILVNLYIIKQLITWYPQYSIF
jgi:hypothetical protein